MCRIEGTVVSVQDALFKTSRCVNFEAAIDSSGKKEISHHF